MKIDISIDLDDEYVEFLKRVRPNNQIYEVAKLTMSDVSILEELVLCGIVFEFHDNRNFGTTDLGDLVIEKLNNG
jgi:hypothetical protein